MKDAAAAAAGRLKDRDSSVEKKRPQAVWRWGSAGRGAAVAVAVSRS